MHWYWHPPRLRVNHYKITRKSLSLECARDRRLLHRNGCDTHVCNAVLWGAQGAGTAESLAWLSQSGADFALVNANGHGALHKAAQRGGAGAVEWLVAALLSEEDGDAASLISTDADGNCPSIWAAWKVT